MIKLVGMEQISFKCPIGRICIKATPEGIASVQRGRRDMGTSMRRFAPLLWRAKKELLEYLSSRRRRFTVKVDLSSGTPFQKRVWREIAKVPYGKVITYGELASRAGCPNGARAAGQAAGTNPVGIIVPCHRIVAAGGNLGGYGGGSRLKMRLLELEGSWPLR